MMKLWSALLVAVLLLGSLDAEAARRFGGGQSLGRQSSNVTQRQAAPAAPGAVPGNAGNANSAAAARPGTPAAAPAAAAAPRKPWAGMLGGLAAGLGLAWLAHSLGMGGALGQILLFGLLALAVMMVIGFVMRSRRGPPAAAAAPYAFQGAGAAPPLPEVPRQYNPANIGNDASARPWENTGTAFDARPAEAAPAGAGGVVIGSALGGAAASASTLSGSQAWGVPEGFDAEGFLSAAKRNFVVLQDAWDRSDMGTLRAMMTDGMVGEIRVQLSEREGHTGGRPNKTDVVMLEAQLLGIEDVGEDYLASVEFSGMIREEPSAGPSPFREVWNMAKPKDGRTGWLVAGVQALQ
ncbi:MAG: TIM44-like domain-containing protein [Pseudomonadota bacterium]